MSKIEKMQVYKIELQKTTRWNGPSGPPQLTDLTSHYSMHILKPNTAALMYVDFV
jgi:hypothetical protein